MAPHEHARRHENAKKATAQVSTYVAGREFPRVDWQSRCCRGGTARRAASRPRKTTRADKPPSQYTAIHFTARPPNDAPSRLYLNISPRPASLSSSGAEPGRVTLIFTVKFARKKNSVGGCLPSFVTPFAHLGLKNALTRFAVASPSLHVRTEPAGQRAQATQEA